MEWDCEFLLFTPLRRLFHVHTIGDNKHYIMPGMYHTPQVKGAVLHPVSIPQLTGGGSKLLSVEEAAAILCFSVVRMIQCGKKVLFYSLSDKRHHTIYM